MSSEKERHYQTRLWKRISQHDLNRSWAIPLPVDQSETERITGKGANKFSYIDLSGSIISARKNTNNRVHPNTGAKNKDKGNGRYGGNPNDYNSPQSNIYPGGRNGSSRENAADAQFVDPLRQMANRGVFREADGVENYGQGAAFYRSNDVTHPKSGEPMNVDADTMASASGNQTTEHQGLNINNNDDKIHAKQTESHLPQWQQSARERLEQIELYKQQQQAAQQQKALQKLLAQQQAAAQQQQQAVQQQKALQQLLAEQQTAAHQQQLAAQQQLAQQQATAQQQLVAQQQQAALENQQLAQRVEQLEQQLRSAQEAAQQMTQKQQQVSQIRQQSQPLPRSQPPPPPQEMPLQQPSLPQQLSSQQSISQQQTQHQPYQHQPPASRPFPQQPWQQPQPPQRQPEYFDQQRSQQQRRTEWSTNPAIHPANAAPASTMSNEVDSPGSNAAVDYNTVMGHFKDFFMYMPVMMTTIKETMSGFPKFAEGIRILASKNGRLDDDCKCKQHSSNEITTF